MPKTPEMDAATAERVSAENMRLLENIDVALTVEVGKAEIKIRDLLRLNEGSVIELDRLAGDALDMSCQRHHDRQGRGGHGG